MTRAEKAKRILEILDELYPIVPIPLDHVDPFTLLVAVVLSAQTTDKKVNQVTPSLFARASTPAAMAALPVEEIHYLIREIGLAQQKAKNIRRLSEILVDDTAARCRRPSRSSRRCRAWATRPPRWSWRRPSACRRSRSTPTSTASPRAGACRPARTWSRPSATSSAVFPEESWGKVHLQIIYFGREHCPALYHDLDACPICSWAATKKHKGEEAKREKALRRRR